MVFRRGKSDGGAGFGAGLVAWRARPTLPGRVGRSPAPGVSSATLPWNSFSVLFLVTKPGAIRRREIRGNTPVFFSIRNYTSNNNNNNKFINKYD